MIAYRFSYPKYANDISGAGAKLKGGRWNATGIPVLYTSEYISLALLEVLANANTLEELQLIKLIEIDIPADMPTEEIKLSQLKKDWRNDFDYTQWLGSELLKQAKSLIIKCPSAIVEQEHNFLFNILHPLFKKIKVKTVNDFYFDERLFKNAE